jgi:glycosyltransferase involved in cell wall biosynthesis
MSKWAEGLLLKRADLSLAVSPVDADVFQGLYGVKPRILPNGVDLERFGNIPDNLVIEIEKKYSLTHPILLFMGLLGFRPNDEALQFLVENILPGVIAKFPCLKLAVIGGRCPIKRDWLINPGSIPFEEVPILIRSADICLAPIFSGSGTKLKILEYLAAGKAVIATPKAIEGIDVEENRDLLVARDSSEFMENILFLLKHPDECRRLGEQGKKKIALHYSWDAIIRKFDHNLEELMFES